MKKVTGLPLPPCASVGTHAQGGTDRCRGITMDAALPNMMRSGGRNKAWAETMMNMKVRRLINTASTLRPSPPQSPYAPPFHEIRFFFRICIFCSGDNFQ
ncbi:hypothetical protein G3B51_004559 [Salmonella enterica]|nr:hypothetical protein [Salmonella enterica]EBE6989606.1 hypothetical protein [Salmonella enterica]EEG5324641.1 hypothetical protein [Salmonella enterica]